MKYSNLLLKFEIKSFKISKFYNLIQTISNIDPELGEKHSSDHHPDIAANIKPMEPPDGFNENELDWFRMENRMRDMISQNMKYILETIDKK